MIQQVPLTYIRNDNETTNEEQDTGRNIRWNYNTTLAEIIRQNDTETSVHT
jgi:hypothetical protein